MSTVILSTKEVERAIMLDRAARYRRTYVELAAMRERQEQHEQDQSRFVVALHRSAKEGS